MPIEGLGGFLHSLGISRKSSQFKHIRTQGVLLYFQRQIRHIFIKGLLSWQQQPQQQSQQ